MPGRQATSGESYRYGYQGQFAEEDEDAGWVSFELRNYDARIARWTSIDPADQYNSPYMAMGNDPVNMIDPDGAFAGPINPLIWGRIMGEIVSAYYEYNMEPVEIFIEDFIELVTPDDFEAEISFGAGTGALAEFEIMGVGMGAGYIHSMDRYKYNTVDGFRSEQVSGWQIHISAVSYESYTETQYHGSNLLIDNSGFYPTVPTQTVGATIRQKSAVSAGFLKIENELQTPGVLTIPHSGGNFYARQIGIASATPIKNGPPSLYEMKAEVPIIGFRITPFFLDFEFQLKAAKTLETR
jgi:RHS repeat-associated protein